MTNVYLKITIGGHVYDQSFGKNTRLAFSRKYVLREGGNIEFNNINNEIYITRRDRKDRTIYKKSLENGKHYISTPQGCEIHLKRSRFVNTAYRYIRDTMDIYNEVLITNDDKDYTLYLVVQNGVIDYKLNIEINDRLFDYNSLSRLTRDIDRINTIDFVKFIRHYNAISTKFVVNREFFNIVDTLGYSKSTKSNFA